jgi:hypothetical protein
MDMRAVGLVLFVAVSSLGIAMPAVAGGVQIGPPGVKVATHLPGEAVVTVIDGRTSRGEPLPPRIVGVGTKTSWGSVFAFGFPTKKQKLIKLRRSIEEVVLEHVDGAALRVGLWPLRHPTSNATPRLLATIDHFWCSEPGRDVEDCAAAMSLELLQGGASVWTGEVQVRLSGGSDNADDAVQRLVDELGEGVSQQLLDGQVVQRTYPARGPSPSFRAIRAVRVEGGDITKRAFTLLADSPPCIADSAGNLLPFVAGEWLAWDIAKVDVPGAAAGDRWVMIGGSFYRVVARTKMGRLVVGRDGRRLVRPRTPVLDEGTVGGPGCAPESLRRPASWIHLEGPDGQPIRGLLDVPWEREQRGRREALRARVGDSPITIPALVELLEDSPLQESLAAAIAAAHSREQTGIALTVFSAIGTGLATGLVVGAEFAPADGRETALRVAAVPTFFVSSALLTGGIGDIARGRAARARLAGFDLEDLRANRRIRRLVEVRNREPRPAD